MKLEKSLEKIKKGLNRLGRFLKDHSFSCSTALVLLAFIGAALIYYFYILNITVEPANQQVNIKTELYNKTINQLKNRETNIQEGMKQNYPDIFR